MGSVGGVQPRGRLPSRWEVSWEEEGVWTYLCPSPMAGAGQPPAPAALSRPL